MEDNNPLIEDVKTRSSSKLSQLWGRAEHFTSNWRNQILLCFAVFVLGVCVFVVLTIMFDEGGL